MNAQTAAIEAISGTVETEQGLLGACLTSPNVFAAVSNLVEVEHFSEDIHRRIWDVMQDLARSGRVINPMTVGVSLPKLQLSDSMNVSQYLARLCADMFCPAIAAPDFAKQIRRAWGSREVLAAIETARANVLSPGTDSREVILDLMRDLDQTRAAIDPRTSGFKTSAQIACAVIDRAAAQYSGTIAANAVPTGLRDLDHMLNGGLHGGELIIVAGRPGMGKTVSAVSFSLHAAQAGHAGGVYSLEMTQEQIGSRYFSDMMFGPGQPIKSGHIFNGRVSEKQFERMTDVAKTFGTLPLHIDDSSNMSVGEISARTRALADSFARQGKRLEFIFIDYLKFIKATDRYRGQRHYEVAEISAGLKSLAKDLNIAVVLLAQLNREVEKREDKRPQLSDLRESGDLEADADVVIFLYREEYYHAMRKPKESDREAFNEWLCEADKIANKLSIMIEKQRMGPTGAIEAFCDVGASAIRDLARTEHFPEMR